MDTQFILNLISRWLHVLPAIVLVGGTLFVRLVLSPVRQQGSIDVAAQEAMRKKWFKWIGICTLLLLLSGLYNAYVKASMLQLSPVYVGLMMLKIVLALGVFFLAARLSGRSAKAVQMRERETHWLNILCLLMVAIVVIGGWMKTASGGFAPKQNRDSITQAQEVSATSSSHRSWRVGRFKG